MSILKNLITSLENPTAETPRRELPESTFARAWPPARQQDLPEGAGDAGTIRRRRSPGLPNYVLLLPWGDLVPDWVFFEDVTYERGGTWNRPTFQIVDTRPVPAWVAFSDVQGPGKPDFAAERLGLPNDFPACYWCGRHLYYRTSAGYEFCFTCHPPSAPQEIRGEFREADDAAPTIADRPNIENVEFFLKPGFGKEF